MRDRRLFDVIPDSAIGDPEVYERNFAKLLRLLPAKYEGWHFLAAVVDYIAEMQEKAKERP